MKRSGLLKLVLVMLVLGICLIPAAKAEAKNSSMVNLKQNTTYKKYDITGDKKNDKIKIKTYEDDYWYTKLVVSVNGKETVFDYCYYDVTTKLITLKNGKTYLWIKGQIDNDDDPWEALYQYKNGKMVKALDFAAYTSKYGIHTGTTVTKVSGNKIYVDQRMMSAPLAGVEFKYVYEYKHGKLKRTSNKANITYASYIQPSDNGYGTLLRKKTIYSTPTGSKKVATLKKGTKAKAVKIYMTKNTLAVKIKTKDGKTGWIKCNGKFSDSNRIFKECMYAG